MGKLKPIGRQISKDVKQGDLVRLVLKDENGQDAGSFVSHYSRAFKPFEQTDYKKTHSYFKQGISFNSLSERAKQGDSSMPHLIMEEMNYADGRKGFKNYYLTGRNIGINVFVESYEVLDGVEDRNLIKYGTIYLKERLNSLNEKIKDLEERLTGKYIIRDSLVIAEERALKKAKVDCANLEKEMKAYDIDID